MKGHLLQRFVFMPSTQVSSIDSVPNAVSPVQLQVINLGKTVPTPVGELVVLEGISFTVMAGQSIAIVGASGSGKSTLLGLLAGLDQPSSGQITLEGLELAELDEDQLAALRALRVGFIFQSFQLLPSLNALENVMLPLELAGQSGARQQAHALLERVGLDQRLHHYPRQLSGGEQQRVAIARAFACKPAILFADEPTGNLDQGTGANIIELLFEINREQGTTLLLVTHDPKLAGPCDLTLELQAGHLLRRSTD